MEQEMFSKTVTVTTVTVTVFVRSHEGGLY